VTQEDEAQENEVGFDLGEADEELGSPLLTAEMGWVVGLVVGLILLLAIRRRNNRKRKSRFARPTEQPD
jgi:hypothetical protein